MKSRTLAIAMSAAALPMALGAVVLPIAVIGCSGAGEEVGEGAGEQGDVALILPDPSVREAALSSGPSGEDEKLCGATRADWIATRTVHDGNWGSWGCVDWCPSQSYVYGVDLRSEAQQGGGDDTAANGISGWCFNRNTGQHTAFVTSTVGGWGSWQGLGNPAKMCTNANLPIAGGRLRVEGSQGDGDDTSANSFKFACLGSPATEVEVLHSNTNWGSWGAQALCAGGTAVCGIQTRVEGNQGGGDDTSLNGVRFYCCSI